MRTYVKRKAKHTHKYERLHDGLWHCARSDCYHYMPHNCPLLPGKLSVCWNCGNIFILNDELMTLNKPICYGCIDRIRGK